MSNRTSQLGWLLFVLLLGIVLGYLLREWLSQRPTPPDDDEPAAKRPPMTHKRNIVPLDDLEETG